MYTQYNRASKFRSEVIAKVAASDVEIARLKLQSKDADTEEKAKIKDKIKKQNEERRTALALLTKYQEYFENSGSWHVADDIIEAVNESIIQPFNQKPLVQKTDSQISELRIKDFKPKQVPTPPIQPTPSATPSGLTPPNGNTDNPDSPSVPTTPVTPSAPAKKSEFDHYKGLSRVERDLVKKFLSVINAADIPDKAKERMYTRLRKKIIKK